MKEIRYSLTLLGTIEVPDEIDTDNYESVCEFIAAELDYRIEWEGLNLGNFNDVEYEVV